MSNITLAIDNKLLQESRKVAAKNSISLNAMIRNFLINVTTTNNSDWFNHFEVISKQAQGDSGGWKFNREEIYNERQKYLS